MTDELAERRQQRGASLVRMTDVMGSLRGAIDHRLDEWDDDDDDVDWNFISHKVGRALAREVAIENGQPEPWFSHERHVRCYSDTFDAYFCYDCDEWLELPCADAECTFCRRRPSRPVPQEQPRP